MISSACAMALARTPSTRAATSLISTLKGFSVHSLLLSWIAFSLPANTI